MGHLITVLSDELHCTLAKIIVAGHNSELFWTYFFSSPQVRALQDFLSDSCICQLGKGPMREWDVFGPHYTLLFLYL